jgi:hypothetical protein
MPMRRAVLCAVLLGLLAFDSASALQPGAPRQVRTARPADAQPRSGALMEDWALELVHPRSRAQIALRIFRSPDEGSGARLDLNHGGRALSTDDIAYRPEIVHRGRSWTLRFSSPTSQGDVRLGRALPGITARRWRLGREAGFAEHVTLSWSTPVATSRAAGSVRIGDQTVDLRGWRGTLEHRWGTFSRQWRAWDHLGAGLIHARGGSAWMLQGLNRRDLLTGAGARDAFWLGLLVHVTPTGTSFCRPRIVRRRWLVSLDGPLAVASFRAACAGRRVRFRRLNGDIVLGSGFGELGEDARASARPRGPAWIRYAGHDY